MGAKKSSLLYPQKWFPFSRPRKWLFLLVKLCDLSGNHHNSKAL